MTIVEKILARASGKRKVVPGEYVTGRIDMAMMPENFRMLRTLLKRAGIDEQAFEIWDPERFAAITDHRVPPYETSVAENQSTGRKLARQFGVKYYYDVLAGIGHQVMVEKGHVLPGELIVGSDSHSTTYGALNAASTGIGASEMAYVVGTGELWFLVPETIKFDITGRLSPFVMSKDIVLSIAGRYTTEVAQYKAIEWTGSAIDELSIDARLTMGNMSVELGAKFGIFKADQKTVDYVKARTNREFHPIDPDADAAYAQVHTIDGSALVPQVAVPHTVGNVRPVTEVAGTPIDQAVIASCCHGRIEDFEMAARIMKGRRVARGVRFYIAPASWEVYRTALEEGLLARFLDAGAMIGNPSCGFCTGYQGVLASGEVCIAATPRNFKGRMGSPQAEIFLASPATVAASAIAGRIVDPREVQ